MTLKRSEKRLLIAFGLVVFVLGNLFGSRYLREHNDEAEMEASSLRDQIDLLSLEVAEKETWAKRRAWLGSRELTFTDETTEAPKLEGVVTQYAGNLGVNIDNIKPVAFESGEHYDRIGIMVAVSGPNDAVVRFISLLQKRDGFRIVPSFKLKPDKKDPSVVKAELTVSQLYSKTGAAVNTENAIQS